MIQSERPKIVLGRGPRACQQALFASINLHLQELGTQALERPLHLLVPSHSLRSHLLERLVLERGRSVAGLSCWTLRGLAREILERAGATESEIQRIMWKNCADVFGIPYDKPEVISAAA